MPNKILQRGSLVPGAVPTASQLVTNSSGVEIAINAADGKLYFKDIAGNVRLLADVSSTNYNKAAITYGSIDGTTIGDTVPSSGQFTSVKTGSLTIASLSGLLKSNATSGVSSAVSGVDYLSPSSVGIAGGVAALDATGKVPVAQLPQAVIGSLYYAGFWNAASNTPTLSSSIGANGTFYRVSVAGSTSLNGINSWNVGDLVIFNGTHWDRSVGTNDLVHSVNGLTGAVNITLAALGGVSQGANSTITSLTGLTTALSVSQGGTGSTTLTGILKGNGSAAFSSAIAGTDYAVPPTGSSIQLLANNGSGGFSNVTVGSGLSYTGGVLTANSASTGTVTSVGLSGGITGLTVTGGPITNTGTMTLDGVLSIGSGGTGAVTRQAAINALAGSAISGTYLRANGNDVIMSGIQASDVPTLNQDTTGTASLVTNASQPNIKTLGTLTGLTIAGTTEVQGPLQSAGNPGSVGQVLTSAGLAGPPVWTTPASTGSGPGVTSVAASGGTTGLTFGGSPITSTGTLTLGGVLSVVNGGTGATTSTGSGGIVKENAPVITGASLFNGEANNLIIGGAVPASGTFTTVSANAAGAKTVEISTSMTLVGGSRILLDANPGLAGQSLRSGGPSGTLYWGDQGSVTSVSASGGTTGLTFLGNPVTTNGTLTLDGVLLPNSGGTGVTSSTGSGSNVLSVSPSLITPDLGMPSAANLVNAVGLPLGSGTTGTLAVSRGGTGATTLTGILKGNGGSAFTSAVAGTDYAIPPTGSSAQLLANDGSGGFSNVSLGTGLSLTSGVLASTVAGAVTSVNVGGGTTGLTFSGGPVTTSGTLVMSGTLKVANGGTGAATLSGLVKGNGTTAMTAAVAGVDYAPATTATTAQLLAGNASGGFNNVTVGAGLFLSGGVLTSVSGTGTVSSITLSGGSTGLTFLNNEITSSGTATLSGVLAVSSGGTGAATLTGLVKGNGTGPMTVAHPRIDYAPATTASLTQLLAGDGGGGFANVNLGLGLSYSGGLLNTTGMGPSGSVLSFAGRMGVIDPTSGDYTAAQVSAVASGLNLGSTVQAQLDNLGGTTGAANVGFIRSEAQSSSRSVGSKLVESLSVLDFGADPSGLTSSAAQFAAVYAAASPGAAILIPAGVYAGVVLTGTKHVNWIAYGKPTSSALWALPGRVINNAGLRQSVDSTSASADENSGTAILRSATYTGGSPLIYTDAASVSTVVGAGNTNVERNLYLSIDSSAASNGNTALAIDAYANGSGSLTAATIAVSSPNADPTASVEAMQLDVFASGTDANKNRSGLVINAKTIGSGAARATNGLLVNSGVGSTATFDNGITLVGHFTSGVAVSTVAGSTNGVLINGDAVNGLSIIGNHTTALAIGGSNAVGIDLSGSTNSDAAIKIADTAKLAFDQDTTRYITHTAGGLTYYSGAIARHQLMDNGDLFLSGRPSFLSAATTSSAGSASGLYLTVLIDGAPFKLALLN